MKVLINPYTIDSYTTMLLHMDGYNGGQVFKDTIGNCTITVNNIYNKLPTKFGKTSMMVGGANVYASQVYFLSTPYNANVFGFGTAAFTIDCWVYWPDGSGSDTYAGIFAYVPKGSYATGSNKGAFLTISRTGAYFMIGNQDQNENYMPTFGEISTGAWHHVALSFPGSGYNYYLYLDGACLGGGSITYNNWGSLSQCTMYIGTGANFGSAQNYEWYLSSAGIHFIDEFRISKGIDRYKSTSYKVPKMPYGTPDSAFYKKMGTGRRRLVLPSSMEQSYLKG